jgi:hypothetical protein
MLGFADIGKVEPKLNDSSTNEKSIVGEDKDRRKPIVELVWERYMKEFMSLIGRRTR